MKTCNEDGCERTVYAKGICSRHYDRIRKKSSYTYNKVVPYCIYEGCESTDGRGHRKHRYCPEHFDVVLLDPNTQITHRHATVHGYVIVTVMGKPFREHRLIMERYLGRRLTDKENIHHINGDRQNNAIENLELWSEDQPAGQRVSDKIKWALQIIERYGSNPDDF